MITCAAGAQVFSNYSARIYNGPKYCQPVVSWLLGDPSCDAFTREVVFWTMDLQCKRTCGMLRVKWEPMECEDIAILIITP